MNQGAGVWLDAIQVGNVFQSATLNVSGSLVAYNKALSPDNFGGGIGNAGFGAVTIANSTIEHNFSGGVGGGFADQNNQGTLSVQKSIFLGNVAVGNGGAIPGARQDHVDRQHRGRRTTFPAGWAAAFFANGITLTVVRQHHRRQHRPAAMGAGSRSRRPALARPLRASQTAPSLATPP